MSCINSAGLFDCLCLSRVFYVYTTVKWRFVEVSRSVFVFCYLTNWNKIIADVAVDVGQTNCYIILAQRLCHINQFIKPSSI